MQVENGLLYPGLSAEIKPYFQLITTKELTEHELNIIGNAMLRTIRYPEFVNQRKRKLVVVLTDSNSITLKFDEDTVGIQGNITFIKYLIFNERNDYSKSIILIEEFVHHFWDTDDESFVKNVVLDIIKDFCDGVSYDHRNMLYLLNGTPMGLR